MASRKKALVTGASEGIGRAIALRLDGEGYDITAVARNEERLQALMNDLSGDGHTYLLADLATRRGVSAITGELDAHHYDLLVNNAGLGRIGLFHESPWEEQERMMKVNGDALVALSHAYLRHARRGDALINLASLTAVLPMPFQSIYTATKAFIASFSQSLWFEQRERGVYVAGVFPGATESEFFGRAGIRGEKFSSVSQTADQVAETTLRALRARRDPVVVSGTVNRCIFSLARFVPRKALLGAMSRMK